MPNLAPNSNEFVARMVWTSLKILQFSAKFKTRFFPSRRFSDNCWTIIVKFQILYYWNINFVLRFSSRSLSLFVYSAVLPSLSNFLLKQTVNVELGLWMICIFQWPWNSWISDPVLECPRACELARLHFGCARDFSESCRVTTRETYLFNKEIVELSIIWWIGIQLSFHQRKIWRTFADSSPSNVDDIVGRKEKHWFQKPKLKGRDKSPKQPMRKHVFRRGVPLVLLFQIQSLA